MLLATLKELVGRVIIYERSACEPFAVEIKDDIDRIYAFALIVYLHFVNNEFIEEASKSFSYFVMEFDELGEFLVSID